MIFGLRVDVEGHLATALFQNSVLDLLKKGSAVEREGGGRGLGDGRMSNGLGPTNRISPQTPLITRNSQILEYWKPGRHFSRFED